LHKESSGRSQVITKKVCHNGNGIRVGKKGKCSPLCMNTKLMEVLPKVDPFQSPLKYNSCAVVFCGILLAVKLMVWTWSFASMNTRLRASSSM